MIDPTMEIIPSLVFLGFYGFCLLLLGAIAWFICALIEYGPYTCYATPTRHLPPHNLKLKR